MGLANFREELNEARQQGFEELGRSHEVKFKGKREFEMVLEISRLEDQLADDRCELGRLRRKFNRKYAHIENQMDEALVTEPMRNRESARIAAKDDQGQPHQSSSGIERLQRLRFLSQLNQIKTELYLEQDCDRADILDRIEVSLANVISMR